MSSVLHAATGAPRSHFPPSDGNGMMGPKPILLVGATTVLSRIILAFALILGALFLLPVIGTGERGKKGNVRFLPLLIAALFIAALFLKYLIAIALLLVVAGMLIVAVLRATGARLFGNRKVSLWLVAAVLSGMYYGILLLVRWAAF